MAYKVSGSDTIKDDKTVIFENVTATVRRHPASSEPFRGIGGIATFGYYAGGRNDAPGATQTLQGDRYPFASDTDAVSIGNALITTRELSAAASSTTHGYVAGGSVVAPTIRNQIEKFTFAASTTSSDVGDLDSTKRGASGSQSATHGYFSGGSNTSPVTAPSMSNVIQKVPFSTDENASDVGDLTQARFGINGGQSSETHGYASGGRVSPPNFGNTTIDKFPFSTDANATDVGDVLFTSMVAGQSSVDNGYLAGGYGDPSPAGETYRNAIQKFPFATDANATDVGDLTQGRYGAAGSSSATNGYSMGGWLPGVSNVIDKFPFSTDTNATDVGNLAQSRYGGGGAQG
jgi:hypothetical protein